MGISLQPNPDETPWIDAWIRWERDPVGNDDNDDDEDGNEDYQPESPTQTFACRYDGNTKHPTIDISLKGFPSDSQETWNSTGKKTAFVCHFMCVIVGCCCSMLTPCILLLLLLLFGFLYHRQVSPCGDRQNIYVNIC